MRHNTNRHRSRRRTISITAASATALAVVAATAAVQSNAFGTEENATAASQSQVEAQAQECGAGEFQAEVAKSGDTWKARNGDTVLYTGDDMFDAMNAGVASLTPNRTAKERMVVRGSGTISASERLKLPSFTVLDVCGTINAVGAVATDTGPIFSRDTTDVEVQHAKITGAPMYGMFFRSVSNLTLGQIDMRLSGGLGIRIDNGSKTAPATNTRIDNVYVSGATSNAVETAGLDGVTIGKVTARDVGEAGLLLNLSLIHI